MALRRSPVRAAVSIMEPTLKMILSPLLKALMDGLCLGNVLPAGPAAACGEQAIGRGRPFPLRSSSRTLRSHRPISGVRGNARPGAGSQGFPQRPRVLELYAM